tara:strand:+ start:1095 stop:1295 length:201 start_codon:yes stop_codon:yes gene_type:complete
MLMTTTVTGDKLPWRERRNSSLLPKQAAEVADATDFGRRRFSCHPFCFDVAFHDGCAYIAAIPTLS